MTDTETPRTAADVLREHRKAGVWDCSCGWSSGARRGSWWPSVEQHQEDMLAAVGLLATAEHSCWDTVLAEGKPRLATLAEHDREVAAQALRDLVADRADIENALTLIEGSEVSVADLIVYRANARADRIAAGEEPL